MVLQSEARQVTGRTLEVADIAESIREYLSQERCDDGPVVFPCVIRMMPGAAETLLKFIENAQGQRERLAALDNAPRWSRHSERCGVAAALGVTTDRVDLDSVVYAVVKKLMDMRGGAAILSIELQEWMGKWPHQAASRR